MIALLRVVGILLMALGGLAVLMAMTEKFDPPPVLHSSLRSPVLAMELVRSAEDARSVLRDPEGGENRTVMRRLIALDWCFIAAYALAFCGLGVVLRACRWPGARALGTLAILLAGAAALADIAEDLSILNVLDTNPSALTDAQALTTRRISLVKWGLLAAFELVIAPLFLAYERLELVPRCSATLAGLAFVVASVLGFAGLAWNQAIEWSLASLAIGLLASLPVLLLHPARFLAGIDVSASKINR